ncbi:unnamed protein product [Polarella glacialis]|uniref:Pyrroline-5-carboxylate reductase n=1 Tax=Polarella glacialis TaxID=89957 RepID=A0A813LLN5_POLGL|nr:unnamed protein product [Polarella glacialis]CAE8600591.1 unnamed protein product [Polarella glacialis]CAE8732864.1 unnamed protein product [Polarella glacialis]|mmetsp:Transcript_67229/g.121101  ORF Transcript_67229/g.121101 Transcript_67229/m.121101 type:complete len:405 (-) Transcript_67229:176-1390(-)
MSAPNLIFKALGKIRCAQGYAAAASPTSGVRQGSAAAANGAARHINGNHGFHSMYADPSKNGHAVNASMHHPVNGMPAEGVLDPMPFPMNSAASEAAPAPEAPQLAPAAQRKELRELRLGFVGWGSMAQAISLGLLQKEVTIPEGLMVSGRRQEVLDMAEKEGIATSLSNQAVAEWADIVVVAVKPQVVSTVMPDITRVWTKDKILVSVCAGVTIDTFLDTLGQDAKVVRTMPNTPCLVGEAATAYAGSSQCEDWELDLVGSMFSAVGNATHRVPEHLLNTVTGVSGSGPAYVYMMIQALSDAGVHGGLPRSMAISLATQTVLGAAKMVQESGKHPIVLRDSVTSPAGTTIAGVRVLEELGFSAAVMGAVQAAKTRSEELSQTSPVGGASKSRPRSRVRGRRGN